MPGYLLRVVATSGSPVTQAWGLSATGSVTSITFCERGRKCVLAHISAHSGRADLLAEPALHTVRRARRVRWFMRRAGTRSPNRLA
jgi:hypothetical protein